MNAFCFLILSLTFHTAALAGASVETYTGVLTAYLKDGLVDYRGLCKDPRLNEYIRRLGTTNPEIIPTRNAKLAFWINAYNAYTLKVICDHYPIKSINDLHFGGLLVGQILGKTIWHKKIVTINNQQMSLNDIEHNTVRPLFKDPRIHFALVCAAMGCPPLRSEAYQGDKLDHQLNEQAKTFLNNPQHNRFDITKKRASISKIFDWYGKDFAATESEVLLYLARYLPKETANAVRENPQGWKLEYNSYDWSLNERKPEAK